MQEDTIRPRALAPPLPVLPVHAVRRMLAVMAAELRNTAPTTHVAAPCHQLSLLLAHAQPYTTTGYHNSRAQGCCWLAGSSTKLWQLQAGRQRASLAAMACDRLRCSAACSCSAACAAQTCRSLTARDSALLCACMRHMLTVFQKVGRVHESLAALLDCLHLGLVRRWLPDPSHKTVASSGCPASHLAAPAHLTGVTDCMRICMRPALRHVWTGGC